MAVYSLENIASKNLLPGFDAKFIHTENITVGYVTIKVGSALPTHAHLQEQITTIIEGTLELTINGETSTLTKGMVAVIAANLPHSAKALTDCYVMDVFHPVREDYKALP